MQDRDERQAYNSLAQQEGERVKGIEPSYAAWEAAVLPLNYTREFTSVKGAKMTCINFA